MNLNKDLDYILELVKLLEKEDVDELIDDVKSKINELSESC